jgi:hypothetical protein
MGLAFIFDTVELRANLTVHYGAGPEELQLTNKAFSAIP